MFSLHIQNIPVGTFSNIRVFRMNVCTNLILIFLLINCVDSKVVPHVKCSKDHQILWPDYNDNRFYFECIGIKNFVRRPCPSDLVFNYHTQQCSWLEDWIELPQVIPLIEKMASDEYSPSCLEHELHWLWPNPTDPQEFFRCTGIGEYERNLCPPGEVFVFMIQMCEKEQLTTTTTLRPADRYPNCKEHELHITWPDPWNDGNFFICTGIGAFELHECPPGFVFVFMLQMCVEVGGGETTTEIQPTVPTSPPVTTPISTSPKTTIELTSSPLLTTTYTTFTSPETSPTTLQPTTISVPTESSTVPVEPTTVESTTMTETDVPSTSRATPPTAPHQFDYEKPKCIICWRPSCTINEVGLKLPDYDNTQNYFQCLSEGEFILKSCHGNFIFDFKAQKCSQ